MSEIERRVDKLGRIVLPKGYRERLKLSENSKVSISIDDNAIIVTPTEKKCIICASKKEIHPSLNLCSRCIKRVKNEL